MSQESLTSVDEYVRQVSEAAAYLSTRSISSPIGIILGTGLGRLADEIDAVTSVDYEDIPNFPVSTVETHHGKLIFGKLAGKDVIALQGRFHLYEGYSARQITLPVRVMRELGVETILVSNAAGGMNPVYRRGDVMLISDHINLQGVNPLAGQNHDPWGPRFPDMSDPYAEELRQIAREVAREAKIYLQEGVYVAVTGPNLETRAEYRFLRGIGADAVGMSTVPEVIVANHSGAKCVAVSVITDECFPDALEPVSIEDVLAAAGEAEPKLTTIMKGIVARL
ncbi:MAG: purine-nucleoside phosphorylase [Rhodothermales bacterium]|nr:purine-nucleoside phosphorylase [Rhodothermales bacterium]